MRILLSKKAKRKLLDELKANHNCKTLKELSSKTKISFKTLQGWFYEEKSIPENFIPNNILNGLEIIGKKENNWGQVKGGEIGGKRTVARLRKKLGKREYAEMMSKKGKKVTKALWEKYGKKELTKMAIRGKMSKREKESKRLEMENEAFFNNQRVLLNIQGIKFSFKDKEKSIRFPDEMSPDLAEEIGIHLGDGCLSFNKNYFSVKCNKKEHEYVKNFLFPLYNKLYNLNLKIMRLQSVHGFEVYSKALCEFKNRSIGLPYGEKKEKIEIPKCVLKTKNKKIYQALIRGLFDTDGCVYVARGKYPTIQIHIKSKKLIKQTAEMLRKMGFIPTVYKKHRIAINGPTMLNKWIKEINSHNPKNIAKLKQAKASSSVWIRT